MWPNGHFMLNGTIKNCTNIDVLAEAVRFELTMGSHPRRFSRPVHSTTLPRFLGIPSAALGIEDYTIILTIRAKKASVNHSKNAVLVQLARLFDGFDKSNHAFQLHPVVFE